MTAMAMTACTGQKAEKAEATQDNFNYVVDQFADLQILRYQVPGFESLSLKQKQLLYHLSEAALMGRDILFDQNCRYNLPILFFVHQNLPLYPADPPCAGGCLYRL